MSRRGESRDIEKAKRARRCLEVVCLKLRRPTIESLHATTEELNMVLTCLRELEESLKSTGEPATGSRALAGEVSGVHRELARAQTLLSSAGRFIEGWAGLLNDGEEGCGNYTSHGPGPVLTVDRGKVVLHG